MYEIVPIGNKFAIFENGKEIDTPRCVTKKNAEKEIQNLIAADLELADDYGSESILGGDASYGRGGI